QWAWPCRCRGAAAAEPGGPPECLELARRQVTPTARRQRAEHERAQAYPHELLDRVANGVEQTTHEPAPPLAHGDLEPRLRRPLLEDPHLGGERLPVLAPHPAADAAERLVVRARPGRPHGDEQG